MNLTANKERLDDVLGTELTVKEAKFMFKSIAITTSIIWISSDEDQRKDDLTSMLTEGLAVLMYIMEDKCPKLKKKIIKKK